MITIGIVVVIGGFALINGLGKTSAGSLDVGDCFEDPGNGEFSSVTDQDCGEPHDIEVYAKFSGIGTNCGSEFADLVATGVLENPAITIPDDTVVGEIGEEGGGGESLCFLQSPSGGLVGSVVS